MKLQNMQIHVWSKYIILPLSAIFASASSTFCSFSCLSLFAFFSALCFLISVSMRNWLNFMREPLRLSSFLSNSSLLEFRDAIFIWNASFCADSAWKDGLQIFIINLRWITMLTIYCERKPSSTFVTCSNSSISRFFSNSLVAAVMWFSDASGSGSFQDWGFNNLALPFRSQIER